MVHRYRCEKTNGKFSIVKPCSNGLKVVGIVIQNCHDLLLPIKKMKENNVMEQWPNL